MTMLALSSVAMLAVTLATAGAVLYWGVPPQAHMPDPTSYPQAGSIWPILDLAASAPLSGYAFAQVQDSTPPTFVSSELDIGTEVLSITFSKAIDVTPATGVVHSKIHVREQGSRSGGVTLTAAELDTAADADTISFTLTALHLAVVMGLATPELTIEPGAVRDTFGNLVGDTFDVSTVAFVDSFNVTDQDGIPTGVAFSSDGAKMFVAGNAGDSIYEYNLTAPFDVSTAAFVDSFNVTDQDGSPQDVAFSSDGAKMFMVGWSSGRIYEYALTAPFDVSTAGFVDSFDVSSQDRQPAGVAFSSDGAKMFMVGWSGGRIYEYDLTALFDVSTAEFVDSFDISGQDELPTGVAFSSDGAKMFMVGWGSEHISEYALTAPFDVSTAEFVDWFGVWRQDELPEGVAFSSDGAKMFVAGNEGDSIYEYAPSSVYPIRVTDSIHPTFVSSELHIGTGVLSITFSEAIDVTPATGVVHSKMHVREQGSRSGGVTLTAAELDTAADADTISFTLTALHLAAVRGLATPELTIEPGAVRDTFGNLVDGTFDVSTAAFVDSFSVTGQDSHPQDVAFSSDGAKMFVAGDAGGSIYEYGLIAPFGVFTAAFVDSFNVTDQDGFPTGVAFSSDGAKMFVAGNAGDSIYEYNLTAPFDVSTAEFVDSFSVTDQNGSPQGVAFSSDGAKMFMVGWSGGRIYEYNLTAPFDVSTAEFVDSFDVSSQDRFPAGVAFSSGGAKMFVAGWSSGRIYEYDLTALFDVSTAEFVDSFDISGQDELPTGVAFSSGGAKMFVAGWSSGRIYEYALSSFYPIRVMTDSIHPTFVSSELDIGTEVLSITFSEAIDVTPAAGVVHSKIHVREQGSRSGGVTLTAAELDTAADADTISFTLTALHLAAVMGLATPELTIEPGAVRDTSGNLVGGTFDVSTATLVNSFDVSSQDSLPEGVAFSSDGAKMFMAGWDNERIYEYDLTAPFDVSTTAFVDSFDVSGQDGLPTGVAFSSDGAKMFVAGDAGDSIYGYNLTAPFDVSTAEFADSFDVSGQDTAPAGVAFSSDGAKMFVAGGAGNSIYGYNLTAPFDVPTAEFVDSFNVTDQGGSPEGVAFSSDGAKMFVAGGAGGSIYGYDLTAPFDVHTAEFVDSFDVPSQDGFPADVAFSSDGAKMFVAGRSNERIYEYALSSVYPIRVTDSIHPTFVSSELDIGTGVLSITFSEAIDVTPATGVVHSKMHVREQDSRSGGVTLTAAELDTAADADTISFTLTALHLAAVRGLATPELTIEPGAVRDTFGNLVGAAFDVSTAEFADSFDVSGQDGSPEGVAFSSDGAKMFVAGDAGDSIYGYNLTAPFDVSTAEFADSFDVSGQDGSPEGVAFSSDGAKMFMVGRNSERIYEYDLTAPFDVSTAEFVDSFDVSSQDGSPTGVAFSSDGAKMFMVGWDSERIYEYALTAPFDISTAAFVDSLDVSGQGGDPTGVAFSSYGAKMFMVGWDNERIHEYALTAPFDVSMAERVDSFDISGQDELPTGVAFSSDGAKMFVAGRSNERIYEYALSSVYPIRVTDSIHPTFVSSELDIGTGVLSITFSEAIDVTPATGVVHSKMHVREQDSRSGGVTLTAAELDTAADADTISFTLTALHLAAVRGLATPELTIEPGAVRDTFGNLVGDTFDVSIAMLVDSFDVLSQDRFPSGVAFSSDGAKMFMVGWNNERIYEYDLTAPFDVSTAEFADSFSVTDQDGSPTGVALSSDGAKMFVAGDAGDSIYEYDLTAPFDVSTAKFVDSFNVTDQDGSPQGVAFSSDGAKMFVAGDAGDSIYGYNLTAPFDVSTAEFADSFDVSGQVSLPTGVAFSSDGAKMFVAGGAGDSIYGYNLTAPFDVSTAEFADSFDVSGQDGFPSDVAFSSGGAKMFVAGGNNKRIYEYALSSFYPIRVTDSIHPTFVSSELDIGTGVLSITFSKAIDVTSATGVVHSKIHVREQGNRSGGVTLTAAELDTAADADTISFTLTALHLAAVMGLATPELTIEPGAVRDTFGNLAGGTFDASTAMLADSFDVSGQGGFPSGVAFSSDGAKMFVASDVGDSIYGYDLTAPFDVSMAAFVDSFDVSGQDRAPAGVAFSSDGAKMFVAGWFSEHIYEYDLPAPFDVSMAAFVDSFDVSSQDGFPTDVAFSSDGAKMFVAGSAGDSIYGYNLTAPFDASMAEFADSFDVSGQDGSPQGVAFSSDGAKMFVAGSAGDSIYGYDLTAPFDVSTAEFVDSFDVSSQDGSPQGVAFSSDGAKMFVAGWSSGRIYEYALSSVHPIRVTDSIHPTFVSSELDIGTGVLSITFSEAIDVTPATGVVHSKIHVREQGSRSGGVTLAAAELDTAADADTISFTLTAPHLAAVMGLATPELTIEPGAVRDTFGNLVGGTFDVSTAMLVDSFDVSSQDGHPTGVAFSSDGAKMFVADSEGDNISEYDLTAPFDVSMTAFVDSFDVSGQDGSPQGVAFSSDGAKMFVAGGNNRHIYEYDLPAPFDVSTAAFVDSFSVTDHDGSPQGVAFSSGGAKMFVAGIGVDSIHEYDLPAPFDVSMTAFVDSFNVTDQDGFPTDVAFSSDGAKMFVAGSAGDSIYGYDLLAPFDASTAEFADSFDVSSQDEAPTGVAFSSDGAKMFVAGWFSGRIYEYALSSFYPIRVTNVAPTVNAGPDQTVDEGDTVTLSGTATGADPEDTLDYTWSHNSTALTITFADSKAVDTTFDAPNVSEDTAVEFTLRVSDGTIEVTDKAVVTITDSANSPPEVEAGADQEVAEGATVTLSGTVSDDDPEDTLTYEWTHDGPSGITFANSAALSTTFTAPDVAANTTITVTLTANDGTVDASDTLQVTVTDSPNSPPTVNAGPDQTVDEGDTVTLSGTATGADPEDTLDYTWSHNSTALTITFADSKAVDTTFDAPNVSEDTAVEFTLRVSDGTIEVTDKAVVTITDSANSPPEVEAGADQEVAEGATVTLSGTVSDDDPEDTLTYEWTHDGPSGITFANSAALSTTFTAPDVAANTTITVTLTANDGTVDASDTLQVTVTDSPNSPPTVNAGPDQTVDEGDTVTLSGTATGADPEDTLDYTWSHNSTALTITFADSKAVDTTFDAPNVSEDTAVEFTLRVSDGTIEVTDKAVVTITDSANSPPEVEAGADQEVAEGATVTLSGTATDADPEDTLTYEWTHDGPSGITFANSAALSTTFTAPDVAANTTITVTLTANDGTVDASDTLQVTVTDSPNSPPTVNAGQDQEVAEGATVTLSGTVSDDDPEDTLTYEWTHDGPSGITFANSAALSTTFTAPDVAANTTITVTLTANDGTVDASDTLQVTVTDSPNSPPTADAGEDQFITKWKTTDGGESITIPVGGTTGSYTVDWGDGTTTTQSGDATHEYATAGTYTVSISDDFTRINLANDRTNAAKLLSIEQWGTIQWDTMREAFYRASNMAYNATDTPNLSGVTDMYRMFNGATSFNGDINSWDVSSVEDMSLMFFGATSFSQSLNSWDVSSVDKMISMFYGATSFNGDISGWDVSSVTDMSHMFNGATSFNGDISGWGVSSVEDMANMFNGATSFNQSLNSWDVSSVTDMGSMFSYATTFNQSLNSWNVSSVDEMISMFNGATSFNGDINSWDVSSVEDMSVMFNVATSFNQDLNSWDVSSVTDMYRMFYYATSFNQSLNSWDVSSVTRTGAMFHGATSFNGDISGWDVASVTDMSHMFNGATSFNGDITAWDVQPTTDTYRIFHGATAFTYNPPWL